MTRLEIVARSKYKKGSLYAPAETEGLSYKVNKTFGTGELNNPYQIEIELTNANSFAWEGIIEIRLHFPCKNPKFFLPAFLYDRNRGETPQNVPNEFPRIRNSTNSSRPSSPWWMTRSDRLSHPVALAFEKGTLFGISASPYLIKKNNTIQQWSPKNKGNFYQYCGFSCSLDSQYIGYTIGYENAPWLFVKSHQVEERQKVIDNAIKIEQDSSLLLHFDAYNTSVKELTDIHKVLEEVYYKYHESPRIKSDIPTTVKDLSLAIMNDAYLENEHCYAGQVFEKNDGSYSYNKLKSFSWTNGLSVSIPLLVSSLRLNNYEMRAQAIGTINHLLSNSINPQSNLPFDSYKDNIRSNQGWWFDGMHSAGHSSYIIGQGLYYLLKGYEYELKLNNYKHQDWLNYVKKILSTIENSTNQDHEYPYVFSQETGAGIEYDSLGSSWCLTSLAYYSYITGDIHGLKDLEASEQHYYETYVKKVEGFGGPLDTDKATDSEGILGYIRGVKILHQITGNSVYLDHLKDALLYEFTFKFCYNSPIQVPPLSKIGWSSCGGSVTSIANPHIHPMSATVIDELHYYIDKTGNKYFAKRLDDITKWCCQTYNTFDKEYDFGKIGWMSERFCHSQGLLTQKYDNGKLASTWFCLMPWASASILEGLTGKLWDKLDSIN